VRIASSVLSAKDRIPFNRSFAESTLEAMRTQEYVKPDRIGFQFAVAQF
jgi:hypothetical protein